jgi:putative flippase GtrA
MKTPQMKRILQKYTVYIKYAITGGTTAVADWTLLYLFTDVLGVHYLTSAIVAYVCALVINFTGQKYWAFQNTEALHKKQLLSYLSLALFNLASNTLLIYLLVDALHVWYLAAQIGTTLFLASFSFFIYKYIVFKNTVAD